MTDCICYCLENKLYQENDSVLSNNALFVLGISGTIVITGLCLFAVKCKQPSRPQPQLQPPEAVIEVPDEINYYEPAPKYEELDIPNILEPVPPYEFSEQPPQYDNC